MGRLMVIMGSGETSPTMVTLHKDIAARLGAGVRAVLLDTPYGFQENVDDISATAVKYFATSVGLKVRVAAPGEDGLADVRGAGWVFCGPGSPTHALGHWRAGPLETALRDHVRAGSAAIVFASAAACALGRYAVPVYEIYKVGAPAAWVDGLDLLAEYGLEAAVIPHYDNAEGGTHDTRYSYLGERRLRIMERELPPTASVLGVDEHTALVLEPDADRAEVRGRGGVTVRRRGESVCLPAGEVLTMTRLRALLRGESAPPPRRTERRPAPEPEGETLKEIVEESGRRFEAAAEPAAKAEAILRIEAAVAEWAADTEEDEGTEWARTVMRGLIVRLADGGAAPLDAAVPDLVAIRAELRSAGHYELADRVRDALARHGIELRDTPAGTRWT
ncbi:hypothetical protein [Spirillospora sp. CA-294931]|uniref:hypothetical protein n=1 Tax=Spirillospora sp. CA-294931 TaxID=3240042 RepID=UPI003D8EBC7F